ncbi:NAD(P)/FAD-dependent oxidoreductase [Pseudonocardia nigra]|uniref:NAD(P)/FAD-dependent oxidoreductase n=1 Tax=Pseudonocardia nigra TaxID=1921578 RepID=UPI001C5DE61C|nr:FAD-dependent oxidoreductase [Pseudonocardia nigra]
MRDPHLAALADAEPTVYWWDDPARPEPAGSLVGDVTCDLAVVGGGFAGLWSALLAKERDPSVDVVLVEAHEVGWAASGRNGGFCDASLTHGHANGRARFPAEFELLDKLGRDNLDAIAATVQRYGIDCDFERTGELDVAVAPWQVAELQAEARLRAEAGGDVALLDGDAVRAEVASPTYLAGLWDKDGCAMVNPARLAWGLRRACVELGVRLHERTPVRRLHPGATAVRLETPYGGVLARSVAVGTNAFPSPLRAARRYTVPVYDHVLMTEPLSAEQLAAIGWRNRQGLADAGNRFHYYRLTADNRILWGGYDAVYHFGKRVRAEYDQRPETFRTLAKNFFRTFPQLEGTRFTHRWGGAIDTCSRFCVFFGTAHGGRVAYSAGYTGLGVGATRFGAEVVLDLLAGRRSELTELELVRRKPIPFPPEPLSYLGIRATGRALARADERGGHRNLWLRALDAVGMGFES